MPKRQRAGTPRDADEPASPAPEEADGVTLLDSSRYGTQTYWNARYTARAYGGDGGGGAGDGSHAWYCGFAELEVRF